MLHKPERLPEQLLAWINDPKLAIPPLPLAIELNNYAVLSCQGEDAKKFLQGQLSCNLDEVTFNQAQLGCYCDHKGRMLANFWIGLADQDYLIVLPKNISAVFYQELNKFAIFSKVKLIDVSADYQQLGLLDSTDISANFLQFTYKNSLTHLIFPKNSCINLADKIIQLEEKFWELLMLRLGVITIVPETVALFTPQEVNFTQIGGVSFNKGCYRGQEIIARMHYLGKLKQHLYHCVLQNSELVIPGVELISAEQQHLGKVVNAVTLENSCHEVTAVLNDAFISHKDQIELINHISLFKIQLF